METSADLEFVNREAELAFLESCLAAGRSIPALIIVRSPPGFGKSRLTDKLRSSTSVLGQFCVVDPSIRTPKEFGRIHDGFFLQRCAEQLSLLATTGRADWPAFSGFLSHRRWKTASEKKLADALSELPSLSFGYRLALDYASRLLSFGRFSERELLQSDRAEAVRICSEYVTSILAKYRLTLVVREAHHCDLTTLRTLIQLNQEGRALDLIFEYTSEEEKFDADHQKLFLRAGSGKTNVSILDLIRLEPSHLEYLIRRHIRSDFVLSSDFYMAWNGNLSSVIELKFRVGFGRHLVDTSEIGRALGNIRATLADHLGELSSLQRLLLALVAAHVEAISETTIDQAVSSINPLLTLNEVRSAIRELMDVHGFLSRSHGSYRIYNETIATTLFEIPQLRVPLAAAERALRDYYFTLILRGSYTGFGISAAVRQIFRLCARTKDAAGLVRAVEMLSTEVKASQDQTGYVDAVASAVEADISLYANDHDELISWAACLAYDVGEWSRAAALISLRSNEDNFTRALRACALQESGGHNDALSLAGQIKEFAVHNDDRLIALLIEAIVAGCRGEHDAARSMLERATSSPENQASPLLGYAFRFFEIIEGFVDCATKLETSIDYFDKAGLKKSKAYSQLPLAVFHARLGNVEKGRRLIEEAQAALGYEVRDQHMIFNNWAAVELLDAAPDFAKCKFHLNSALRLVRDDYSELTVLNNLALACWGLNELDAAIQCAEKCIAILTDHDFADKDIYWPVCFNLGQIYSATGQTERRGYVLNFPTSRGRPIAVNKQYWEYRYGQTSLVSKEYEYLARCPRHPLYLSHWLIDIDGLNLLKRVRLQ